MDKQQVDRLPNTEVTKSARTVNHASSPEGTMRKPN
jgi:hypothetical protein